MQRVSHSTADAYNACEKRYEYAHLQKLQTKQTPHQLARGTYGHKVLEVFFTAIKNGESHANAGALALSTAISLDAVMYSEIGAQLFHFINVKYPTLGWEPVEIEKTFYLPTGEDSEFPFTVDLIAKLPDGRLWAIDHKFSADPYDDELMEVLPQLPKYIGSLRALTKMGKENLPVYGGMYNFIRTRKMKDLDGQLVVKPLAGLSTTRIQNSMRAQLQTTHRISTHEGPYLRTFNNNCKYCPFLDLCRMEMNGEDTTDLISVMYEANSYGYDDVLEKI